MPDVNKPVGGQISDQDDGSSQKAQTEPVSGTLLKEQEAKTLGDKKEGEIVAEIKTTAEALDSQAIEAVRTSIKDAKLSMPEPKLAPDVADSGVKVPQEQADEVIRSGTTINLPISEDKYKKGLHQKVTGVVVNKVVVGASSFFTLATWIGRLIKMAHKHTMKVIFRKEG